tara:strand:- start:2017 stop:2202 length:186 start_codon:yes stop_codon:yes gene_type:complete
MRNKQIIIKLSDDTNLSILQGRDANSTDDTVEFWDMTSEDVTGYADGKKLYDYLKNFYERG